MGGSEAGSGFFEATLQACTDPLTGRIDNELLEARLIIVPRNSGVQNVTADIQHAMARARRFPPPFRNYAMAMARADKIGMVSISSEQGAYAREFNTTRSASINVGTNTGPQVSDWDEMLYGKNYVKNNPKEKKKGGLF